ncbi:MAG: D-alanyl-D-alanine dipeptidase [Verrucomicrobia bacterium]|nr:D-alanyl-D-alanine dipeptidase [Verrucomicrobiota bacterium]
MNRRTVLFLWLSVLLFTFGSIAQEKPTDLVDVEKFIPGVYLDIRYATTNNFTGQKVYPVAKCYLRRATAEKLKLVYEELQKRKLSLKIYDGYRPLSVQKKFWELVPDDRYVANPAKGSKHNRGGAVDLTLVNSHGVELPMPTPYDDFTEKAHQDYNDLPKEVIRNRALLRTVMEKHGFKNITTEWWHFDDTDWQKYNLMDVSFEELAKQ